MDEVTRSQDIWKLERHFNSHIQELKLGYSKTMERLKEMRELILQLLARKEEKQKVRKMEDNQLKQRIEALRQAMVLLRQKNEQLQSDLITFKEELYATREEIGKPKKEQAEMGELERKAGALEIRETGRCT